MDNIEKELFEQIKEESAYEMATNLRQATLKVMDRADSLLEHFLKVVFYTNDINQNKWRNEMATRITECGRLKNTSTNKKFDKKVYHLLFTTLCSNPEELGEQAEAYYREFLIEGYGELDFNSIDFNNLYNRYMELAEKSLALMIDKKIYTREDYRGIIDVVLK